MSNMEDGPIANEPEPSQDGRSPQAGTPRHKRKKRPDPWRLIRALLVATRIIWWLFEE